MASKRGKGAAGLTADYYLLGRISRELGGHRSKIGEIGRRIARKKITTDLEDGLIENLDVVMEHMRNAKKEVDRAQRKLRMI